VISRIASATATRQHGAPARPPARRQCR